MHIMETQICIFQDIRREKKVALYPIKLRIYYRGKTVLHPTIYDLSKEDFAKLNAKRISDSLGEIRDHLKGLQELYLEFRGTGVTQGTVNALRTSLKFIPKLRIY